MTKQIIRCGVCGGKKNVLSLGALMKKCINCAGIGFVSTPESKPSPDANKLLCDKCKEPIVEQVAEDDDESIRLCDSELVERCTEELYDVHDEPKRKGRKPANQSA